MSFLFRRIPKAEFRQKSRWRSEGNAQQIFVNGVEILVNAPFAEFTPGNVQETRGVSCAHTVRQTVVREVFPMVSH